MVVMVMTYCAVLSSMKYFVVFVADQCHDLCAFVNWFGIDNIVGADFSIFSLGIWVQTCMSSRGNLDSPSQLQQPAWRGYSLSSN